MPFELSGRQVPPFGDPIGIAHLPKQGRGHNERAIHLPAEPLQAFGDIDGVSDYRELEQLRVAQGILPGKANDRLGQPHLIVANDRLPALGRTWLANDITSASLRDAQLALYMDNALPTTGGA